MIIDKFIKIDKGQLLMPPIHNVSIFALGPAGVLPFYGNYHKNTREAAFFIMNCEKDGVIFFSETKFRELISEVFRDYWTGSDILDERKRINDKFLKILEKGYEKLTTDFVLKNKTEDLVKEITPLVNASRTINAISWYATNFDKELCLALLKEVKSNITPEKLDEIWDQATKPCFESFDAARVKDVMNLISKKKSWAEIAEKCQYMYADYSKVANLEEVQKDLEKQYGSISVEEAIKKIKNQTHELKHRKIEFSNWLKKLSTEEQKVVIFLQEIMRVRDNKKNAISKGVCSSYRVARKMLKEAGIPEKFYIYYYYEEMLKGREYLLSIKKKFMTRDKGFMILSNWDGTIEEEYGNFDEALKKIETELYPSKIENELEIKGSIANKGLVRGRVKVIRDPSKANNFQKGDILVTGMTRPEFVPLMKLAAAIVTDEGGITCHAAIVSRELNKPCIIGTRVATKRLKDNDLVEVDANKGIIRILERA